MVSRVVILSLYIITFVIGFPANLLALYAFSVKIHVKANPTDILLLNLTVSDLLFLIFLPLEMDKFRQGMKWDLPTFLCPLTSFILFSTIYTSSLLLMAVSLVRYIALAFPITYHRLQKPVYAVVMGAVIWLITLANCIIPVILIPPPPPSKTPDDNAYACFGKFTKKQLGVLLPTRLEIFFVLCLVPLVICVYCYVQCILIVYSRPRISRMQKQKAIGMALGTLAAFLICMLPYNISHLTHLSEDNSQEWRKQVLLLRAFNTCIDPIISYFSSSIFHCNSKKSIFRKRTLTVPELQMQGTGSNPG